MAIKKTHKKGFDDKKGAYSEHYTEILGSGKIILTDKQRLFIQYFEKDPDRTFRMLQAHNHNIKHEECIRYYQNPGIRLAIRAKQDGELYAKDINSRKSFFVRIMSDETEDTRDRLKAAELLGKMEKDYTDRVEVTGEVDLVSKIYEARNRRSGAVQKLEDALE